MSWNDILQMLGQMETSQETFDSSHPSVPMRQQEQTTNELFSKLDYNGWNESNQPLHGISRTFSCPPSLDSDEKHKVVTTLLSAPASALESKRNGTNTGNGNKKRKDENDGEIIDAKNKKIKRELDSQVMNQRKHDIQPNTTTKPTKLNSSGTKKREETFVDGSKKASKVSDVVEKTDYIHVRARRGQATDNHSLAERVRREKISARMTYLQDLVPGCNKISSKAGMLDEIINYVQCLQRQVEFLSMKMSAVNPIFDFTPEGFFINKENILPIFGSSPVEKGASSELIDPSYPLPDTLQQPTMLHPTLCRTISAPITTTDIFVNTNFHAPLAPYAWNADLQSLGNGEIG